MQRLALTASGSKGLETRFVYDDDAISVEEKRAQNYLAKNSNFVLKLHNYAGKRRVEFPKYEVTNVQNAEVFTAICNFMGKKTTAFAPIKKEAKNRAAKLMFDQQVGLGETTVVSPPKKKEPAVPAPVPAPAPVFVPVNYTAEFKELVDDALVDAIESFPSKLKAEGGGEVVIAPEHLQSFVDQYCSLMFLKVSNPQLKNQFVQFVVQRLISFVGQIRRMCATKSRRDLKIELFHLAGRKESLDEEYKILKTQDRTLCVDHLLSFSKLLGQ
jgi:hypothetical protein